MGVAKTRSEGAEEQPLRAPCSGAASSHSRRLRRREASDEITVWGQLPALGD